MDLQQFDQRLCNFPDGSYDVLYDIKRYLMRKETLLGGRLIKGYAEELGGRDVISFNYYPGLSLPLLKPCEMRAEKVVSFVLEACPVSGGKGSPNA